MNMSVRSRAIAALAGLLAAVSLAACGSSGSGGTTGTSGNTTTTSSGSPTGSTGSGSSSTSTIAGGSGGGSTASKLNALAAAVGNESKATFKLTYTTSSSGTSTTIVLEQSPPKQVFRSGGTGEILFNGTKTYYCSTGSTPPTCIQEASTQATPLGALIGIYSGKTALGVMQGWKSEIAAGIVGYHVSFSNATYAGQASQCVTWSYQTSSAKYCVTNSGVLAYAGGGSAGSSGALTLTSYSSSPPASDFNLPAGATVTSLP